MVPYVVTPRLGNGRAIPAILPLGSAQAAADTNTIGVVRGGETCWLRQ